MFRTQHLIRVAALLVGLFAANPAVQAQSCHSDVQCGGTRTSCAGNTLVTTRSVCAGGQCQSVDVSRVPCASVCGADRCIDGTPGPKRDTSTTLEVTPRCLPGCTCRNSRLAIATGRWSAVAGCEQRVRRCARGCTCEDKPRCL